MSFFESTSASRAVLKGSRAVFEPVECYDWDFRGPHLALQLGGRIELFMNSLEFRIEEDIQ